MSRRGTAARAGSAALALVVGAAAATPAAACPACFGAAGGPMIDAAKLGVVLMAGVTILVQAAFVAFFLVLRRRARVARDRDLAGEWHDLQSGSEFKR